MNLKPPQNSIAITPVRQHGARAIVDIYKARCQVEYFFKWIKQNLKIESFVGIRRNAVMARICIGMCIHLLLEFIKYQSKLTKSLQQILRLLQLKLFERRDLMGFSSV